MDGYPGKHYRYTLSLLRHVVILLAILCGYTVTRCGDIVLQFSARHCMYVCSGIFTGATGDT